MPKLSTFAPLLVLLPALSLTPGCTMMQHENLDQDIPSVLVDEFAVSQKPYVDEGFFWFPLLLAQGGEVAKVQRGYYAERFTTLGPLGLPMSVQESAVYDDKGNLEEYERKKSALWGFLVSSGVTEHPDGPGSEWFKFAFGLLGYRVRSDGERIAYLLWIPTKL